MKLPMDERGPEIRCYAWDRQLRKHAGWSDGAPLLAGCREEYHVGGAVRDGLPM
jgi:hypothetical protein